MLTKYTTATMAYAAAMIGIADDAIQGSRIDLEQISVLQWGAIAVATLSFVVILAQTKRTQKKLGEQKQQRARVQELANIQIKLAIDALLRPYRLFLQSFVAIDAWDRLDSARHVLKMLSDPSTRSGFKSIDVRSEANVYPKCKNWQLLAERTQAARDLLGESVAKFSSYLSAETLEAVENLRGDEMVGMRLPDLQVLISTNEDMTSFTLEHALGGRGDYAAFDAMLKRIGALLDCVEGVANAA